MLQSKRADHTSVAYCAVGAELVGVEARRVPGSRMTPSSSSSTSSSSPSTGSRPRSHPQNIPNTEGRSPHMLRKLSEKRQMTGPSRMVAPDLRLLLLASVCIEQNASHLLAVMGDLLDHSRMEAAQRVARVGATAAPGDHTDRRSGGTRRTGRCVTGLG